MRIEVPVPMSGGLILSYRCTAKCKHCMYGCSPEWSADWISEENLTVILKKLSPYIMPSPYGKENISLNHGLHFSGGEPFMNYDLLVKAVEISEDFGIPSTFVETNCFWCADDDITRERLTDLKNKGMKGIMISVNPFYLEFVPFERTERAIRISQEIFGRNTAVYQLEYYRRFKELGITGKLSIEDYLGMEGRTVLPGNVEFFLSGRAAYGIKGKLGSSYRRYAAKSFFGQPCMPSFSRNWHNHYDNYFNYMPGYCGGISYGDLRELDSILKEGILSSEHPLLSLLIKEDIAGLYKLAGDFGYVEQEKGYYSKCHLCLDLRKHLSQKGDFKELKPAEFYRHFED